ncbi:MAG: phosphoglucosamine mutase [Verrucomicrobiales bacterium]
MFGTDGIRGPANVYPLTPGFALQLGKSIGWLLLEEHRTLGGEIWPSCIIGKDTRLSGGMLESAFAAGLSSVGVDVTLAGVIPTPAIAHLVLEHGHALGAVISASHNPFADNGIKFFGGDGCKFDEARETGIEGRLFEDERGAPGRRGASPTGSKIGRISALGDAAERYIDFAMHSVGHDRTLLRGLNIVVDAANGAAALTTPEILSHLGGECFVIHGDPNGVNINENCGCTHPQSLCEAVRERGADVGLAHDGDADRVLLCDEQGVLLDGDEIMAIAAVAMLESGTLARNTLVATLMSNQGLSEVMQQRGGEMVRAAVGDRHVAALMREGGFNLGGEQSGHFIFRDHNTTGDGVIAALQILQIMVRAGKPLSELKAILRKYPQAQRNLVVREKPPLESLEEAQEAIAETERALGSRGRVLLRYSGTEALVRLLIEGADADAIEARADAIAAAIEARIGA